MTRHNTQGGRDDGGSGKSADNDNDRSGGREHGEARPGGGEGDKNRGGGPAKGGGMDEDGGGKERAL